jgi:predicted membrane-bound spermidine synthase
MKYLIEVVVFLSGAAVMILELCGSRILAPFVGVSIVVWSSLIGTILGSLSLGYFLGGKVADKAPNFSSLSKVLFLSALSVLGTVLLKYPVFALLQTSNLSLTEQTIFSTTVLFVLPSLFLGMISPLAAKIKLENIKVAGKTVGNLYALSTLGSIFGTFLAGFYLIENFPVSNILVGVGVMLLILSILLFAASFKKIALFGSLLLLAVLADQTFTPTNIKVFDSQYNHVQVLETTDPQTQKPIRLLNVNNEWDSAMFLDSNDLVFDYTKLYRYGKYIDVNARSVLMIGGGAYSVPKDFLNRYGEIQVDVVEIDPLLTQIAKQYFNLPNDPRLTISHEDGRTYLNRLSQNPSKKYDIILVDAFKGYSVPFALTTTEALNEIKSLLNDNGVVIINVISSVDGDKGEFLRAEYRTYKQVFPQVMLLQVNQDLGLDVNQNLMLIALKNPQSADIPGVLDQPIPEDKPILTDDFAPVEQYVIKGL